MTFDDEFDNVTLCCPARTSILRGQYSHNTGVLTNGGTNGGFETAHADGVEQATVATAMHDAATRRGCSASTSTATRTRSRRATYRRAGTRGPARRRATPTASSTTRLNQNGTAGRLRPRTRRLRHRRLRPTDHRLHRPGPRSRASRSSPTSPCTRLTNRPRLHRRMSERFPGLQAPRDGVYNEADVSDKPQFIQNLPLLSPSVQTQGRPPGPPAGPVAAGRRPRRRRASSTTSRQIGRARRHVHHLHVRQRVPPRPAPHAGRQADGVRDRRPPAAPRARTRRRGRGHTCRPSPATSISRPTIAELGGATSDRLARRPIARAVPARPAARPGRLAPGVPARALDDVAHAAGSVRARPARARRPRPGRRGGARRRRPPRRTIRPATSRSATSPSSRASAIAGYTYVEYATGEKELYDLTNGPGRARQPGQHRRSGFARRVPSTSRRPPHMQGRRLPYG